MAAKMENLEIAKETIRELGGTVDLVVRRADHTQIRWTLAGHKFLQTIAQFGKGRSDRTNMVGDLRRCARRAGVLK